MGRPLTPLLSVELIAETALEIIDSGEPFSMRRLAKRLGVSAPALYNHVESKDALVELIRGVMVAEHPVPREDGGTWVDRVAAIARAQRAAYSAHPHVVPLLIGVPLAQPDVLEIYRDLARALASAGFDDAEVGVLLEVIDSFAIGNALEQRAPQQIWVDPDDEGALARAMGSWSSPQALLDEAFETGLEFILGGMKARLSNRPRRGVSLLDGLSEPFDHLDSAGARAALREHWGIEGHDPVRLDTERDDTFRAGDVLLKVAHPRDDPAVIEMQSAAMAHVAATDPGIPVQRVVATLDGSQSATVAGRHARVLTWLDGDIVDGQDLPVTFFETAGRMLGRLNRALAGFRHPGAHRDLAWDLPHLPDLRTHTTTPLHLEVIDRFTAETLPALATLPHQVIHNDSHPGNLLVRSGALEGILDFGDAVYSPRVCELAVALAYLVPDGPRPWHEVDALTAGFLGEVPLSDAELAQLPMLMAARTIMRSVINQALQRDAHSDPSGFYAANDRKLHLILRGT